MKKESISVRFLYNTILGRLILKPLTSPSLSSLIGKILSSFISKPMISYYIRKHKINMNEYEKCKYKSFNDFFVRKRKKSEFDTEDNSFISPCDGYLSIYRINEDSCFRIKNSYYNLKELLNEASLANSFSNGYCFIYRLTPRHFHRYCYVDSGEILSYKKIPGILHCVRPVACDRFPVYIQNQRDYALISTKNYGNLIQMEIGAIIVGKINNHHISGDVVRGQEKGYFEFGGSTIIVITQDIPLNIDRNILINSENNIETEVRSGQKIAEKII